MTEPEPYKLLSDLFAEMGDLKVAFWQCPVRAHRDRGRGKAVTTVEWRDNIAHCTFEGCTQDNDPAGANVAVSTISVLPRGCSMDEPGAFHHLVQVVYRGNERWSVDNVGFCLSRKTWDWDYASIPAESHDEWLAEHRYDRDEAVRVAVAIVDTIQVNGRNYAEWQEHFAAVRAGDPT